MRRYLEIANNVERLIDRGIYQNGDRLPSVRILSDNTGSSPTTVVRAYGELEKRGLVEAVPQSGHYVRSDLLETLPVGEPPMIARHADIQPRLNFAATAPFRDKFGNISKPTSMGSQLIDIVNEVEFHHGDHVLDLAYNSAARSLQPLNHLNRSARLELRENPTLHCIEPDVRGLSRLRVQIAKRMLASGCTVSPDEILVTHGCQESLMLSLWAVADPGDIIAVESPAYAGLIKAVACLGLNTLEIPSDPITGINLDILRESLEKWPIKACFAMPCLSNPAGTSMPDEKKEALVSMLTGYDATLIESDDYGELAYARRRLTAAKSFDDIGNVIYCSSTERTIGSANSVGWIVPGKWFGKIIERKFNLGNFPSSLIQLMLARYFESSVHEQHVRKLRRRYKEDMEFAVKLLKDTLGHQITIVKPNGGYMLWVGLPTSVNSMNFTKSCRERGLSVAPGSIFSQRKIYNSYIRIHCSWLSREEFVRAIGLLAQVLDDYLHVKH